jgi:hypothetical protein
VGTSAFSCDLFLSSDPALQRFGGIPSRTPTNSGDVVGLLHFPLGSGSVPLLSAPGMTILADVEFGRIRGAIVPASPSPIAQF